jgi:hypothetical protein
MSESKLSTSHDPQSSEFSIRSFLQGLLGAVAGGVAGYYGFQWALSNGLYAMVLPGALVGLGFGLAARRFHWAYGLVAALLALGLSLFCEWSAFPFVANGSFQYFLTHVHQKGTWTLIMILVGVIMAFSLGRGRNH